MPSVRPICCSRSQGVSSLAQLSSEDVRRLAANLEQVQAAGSVPEYVWILLAAFLAVSTLLTLVIIPMVYFALKQREFS